MSGSSQVTDGVISADTPCQRCSYNLRGLDAEGRCPECGHPASETLFYYTAEIRQAYTHWFARVRSGVMRCCQASVCCAVFPFVGLVDDDVLPVVLLVLVPWTLFLSVSGWFRLCDEPPVRQHGISAFLRRAMGVSLLVAALGAVLAAIVWHLALVIVPVTGFMASQLMFCGGIAGRLRSPLRQAMCYIAAAAVTIALGSLLWPGPEWWTVRTLTGAFALASVSLLCVAQLLPKPGR